MMLLEYDKREFRIIEFGVGVVYRTGYKEMRLVNGFYHILADTDDCYQIPKDKVIVKVLSHHNWLPRL
jgi:hypothetical protein